MILSFDILSLPWTFSNSSLSFASFFTTLMAWVFLILSSSTMALQLSFPFFTSSNILIFSSNVRHRLLSLPASRFFLSRWTPCWCKLLCTYAGNIVINECEIKPWYSNSEISKTKFVFSFGMRFITLLFSAIRNSRKNYSSFQRWQQVIKYDYRKNVWDWNSHNCWKEFGYIRIWLFC